jgi:hypothetical protein
VSDAALRAARPREGFILPGLEHGRTIPLPDLTAKRSKSLLRGGQMGEPAMICPFLIYGFAVFLVGATVYGSVAQTNKAQPKAETRLITLGTVAGPPPRPHRAQFSNLLIVNGTLYVIDAGRRRRSPDRQGWLQCS